MSDLEKIFLTSGLTICGGVIVLVIGQVLLKLFIEPLFAIRFLIGEIADDLVYYANVYANPGTDRPELRQEAKEALRQKASLLRARTHGLPLYWIFVLFGLVPKRKKIVSASAELIGLSNGIFEGNPMVNYKRREEIRSLLRLPAE